MSLSATILAVILSLPNGPSEPHASALADAIATAANTSPLWTTTDDAGEAATAAVLVGIGYHETGLSERLARCKYRKGEADGGRSLGTWQLQGPIAIGPFTRLEVCSSDSVQAERALSVLHRSRKGGMSRMLFAYASGNADKRTQAGRELIESVEKSCARFKLVCGLKPRWIKALWPRS